VRIAKDKHMPRDPRGNIHVFANEFCSASLAAPYRARLSLDKRGLRRNGGSPRHVQQVPGERLLRSEQLKDT